MDAQTSPLNPIYHFGYMGFLRAMKKYRPIKIQLQILNRRGLFIEDIEYAKRSLQLYGYHEIINGYQDIFRHKNQYIEKFADGATFNDIMLLFKADKHLRSNLRTSLEEIELTFKAILIDTISLEFGVKEENYLNKLNFKAANRFNKKLNKVISDRDWLFKRINIIMHSNDEMIIHYRRKGNIPPWILIKKFDFGTLKTFYTLLDNPSLKNDIISRFLDMNNQAIKKLNLETKKQFVADLLNLTALFRNRASHGMRIYDFEPSGRNTGFTMFKEDNVKDSGTYALAMAFSLLANQASTNILVSAFGDFYVETKGINEKFKPNIAAVTNIPICEN